MKFLLKTEDLPPKIFVLQKFWRASKLPTTKRGFTLIEMLVSVAIFTMVATVGIGSLFAINNSNKKAQITRTVMDNLNFALESMARNLRVGSEYHCDFTTGIITQVADCAGGADSIAFEGYKGDSNNETDQIVYRFNGTTQQIERSVNSGATFFGLTAPELSIDTMTFFVTGTPAGDFKQPRVVIVIRGSVFYKNGVKSEFNIETTVSQRKIDS
ncbi:MAG: hypothetical protein A2648_01220 [Candidatus Lloydbacteria bacterium RIFCSPHIGHO2_01_FULL_41_20]|uniref:Prepilin-type N-terminal cleavage/methylation domain-containing protein n=1 Tax=Candidatus Lloydbacteria bacterium RIFCSPHIGHO2_01_FULL_41_20 TaxID=1798657 RepID=A0A1G2CS39_9BACT|nr:MAG: hypothetical protein A2648_01220 [Candidatus Lloydbacteria bacterium RIFCSPHIGHO2_01_FULL_41_20]